MHMLLIGILVYAAILYIVGFERNRAFWPRAHGVLWVGVGLLIPVAVVLMLGVASVFALLNWVSG